jgi:hypothetical protein
MMEEQEVETVLAPDGPHTWNVPARGHVQGTALHGWRGTSCATVPVGPQRHGAVEPKKERKEEPVPPGDPEGNDRWLLQEPRLMQNGPVILYSRPEISNSPLGDISSRMPADVKGLAKGFRRPSSSNPLAVSEIQVRERG